MPATRSPSWPRRPEVLRPRGLERRRSPPRRAHGLRARNDRPVGGDRGIQLDGLRAEGLHPQPWLPRSIATTLCVHESSVLSRLRKRLAETFEQPIDHLFFRERYLPGEDPNAALLRMFKRLQWMVSLTDEQTIDSMARRSHR
ncbi:MAG TPA: hypothetical protein VF516_20010 [Kofleriaceae bacterium]